MVKSIRVPTAKAAALRLLPGDILMNEGGDRDKLGRGWVWSGEIEDCIHQNHVFRARGRGDAIRPKLLSWWTNTIGGEWCERHGRQSVNLASISLSRIRQMPVPVPPVLEQEKLEAAIDEVQDGVARLRESASALGGRASRLRAELLSAAVAAGL
jgi:type I restriction enzyme S subunit